MEPEIIKIRKSIRNKLWWKAAIKSTIETVIIGIVFMSVIFCGAHMLEYMFDHGIFSMAQDTYKGIIQFFIK